MKKATKKEIKELTIQMVDKYCDLVWFARKSEDDFNNVNGVKTHMIRVMNEYPETKDLMGEKGDWTHGFNSGCLAAFRLILGSMENGVEESKEEFPELDS